MEAKEMTKIQEEDEDGSSGPRHNKKTTSLL